jgi:hypothetical protein
MQRLAKAVVDAFAFLELSGAAEIDPDTAVKVMEMLTQDLRTCSPREQAALQQAAHAENKAQKAAGASRKVLSFYEDFTKDMFDDEE